MRIQSRFLVTLTFVLVLALAGCGGSGGGGGQADTLQGTSQALGGEAAIQSLTTQRIVASGQWFEPEQTFQPGDPPLPVSTFAYTLTRDIPGDRFRFDWTREITYPFVQSHAYSEVVDGNLGLVDGVDSLAGAATTGMPSVRLGTLRKLHRLNSPLLLLRSALADPASVEARPNEPFAGRNHRVLALTAESVSPVRLFIDPQTFLPAKADTFQDDPYYGDTLYEVLYEDWRRVGEVMVPHRLTLRLTGLGRTVVVRTEERSSVENGVPAADELFAIPAELQVPFDAADARRGESMAQWFLRRQAIGIPTYSDQGLTLAFEETGPGSGVYFATGGSHNTLIVEMTDHLIALEPPLYESRSLAVIAAARAAVPEKPIRHVVVSHFHIDHGGGVRAYAAEGASVVVGEAVRAHFEAILAAPHTLVPDTLQSAGAPTEVLGVPAEGLTFSDGVRTLGVFPVTGQEHAAGYVLSHVSDEELAFDSGDLFSPPAGTQGTVALSALPESLRQTIQAFALPVSFIAAAHGGLAAVEADLILLPTGFRPEGVDVAGDALFVGSIPTGRVLRADLATGQTEILVDPAAGRSAIGLKVDGQNRLFVAGGATGEAYVYDAGTGAELAVYTLAEPTAGATFINDVIVTDAAAWFTDSRRPVLYRLPLVGGVLPAQSEVNILNLTGADFVFNPEVNNANGIAATPDGTTLIIVQSNTGLLFNVNSNSGEAQLIDLGEESLPNGDGILLDGQTLFVVQNRLNQLAVVSLPQDFLTGSGGAADYQPRLRRPDHGGGKREELFLPNARFGIPAPDTAAFAVVRIARP
jgi:glyoxylase-like metal-dependent hydrolase (beta-lactamase superfamily II)